MAVVRLNLGEVLGYKNEGLVSKFAEDFGLSLPATKQLFTETKKWLWLCARQSQTPNATPLTLVDEMLALDLMWHSFILFTHDYAEFCANYLGAFVHHVPRTPKTLVLSLERQNQRLQATYEYIYDHLGAETLSLWIEKFPVTYKKFQSIKGL